MLQRARGESFLGTGEWTRSGKTKGIVLHWNRGRKRQKTFRSRSTVVKKKDTEAQCVLCTAEERITKRADHLYCTGKRETSPSALWREIGDRMMQIFVIFSLDSHNCATFNSSHNRKTHNLPLFENCRNLPVFLKRL